MHPAPAAASCLSMINDTRELKLVRPEVGTARLIFARFLRVFHSKSDNAEVAVV